MRTLRLLRLVRVRGPASAITLGVRSPLIHDRRDVAGAVVRTVREPGTSRVALPVLPSDVTTIRSSGKSRPSVAGSSPRDRPRPSASCRGHREDRSPDAQPVAWTSPWWRPAATPDTNLLGRPTRRRVHTPADRPILPPARLDTTPMAGDRIRTDPACCTKLDGRVRAGLPSEPMATGVSASTPTADPMRLPIPGRSSI